MKFIDLFAGLGGFHIGLVRAGHECVYASEIDEGLARLYEKNFKIKVDGDIKKVNTSDIPKHDILCAGFPCQPFSKAGRQMGLRDKIRGSLMEDIVRILRKHRTTYFVLENVANLLNHDNKTTWRYIKNLLESIGYEVDEKILSPHQYGIPQHRQRLFIVGSLKGLKSFSWPVPLENYVPSIADVLDIEPKNAIYLSKREIKCLNIWQKFLGSIPKKNKLPSFPIWSMEFGATYPFEQRLPELLSQRELGKFRGAFGVSLKGFSREEQLALIPRYALGKEELPSWKKSFIRQNRLFLEHNRKYIATLYPEIKKMPFSWQKLEWNCQGEKRDLKKCIIQFRSSGVRIKRSNFAPTLVSASSTQRPILGFEHRYMTKIEAARLQSLEKIELPEKDTLAFKALGNAVNASLVYLVAKQLIKNKNE